MKKKKLLVLALAAVMLLGLLAGCGNNQSKGSVYWLNFKPEADELLNQVAKTYTDKTGVPVKIVTAASGTYSQTLVSEMDKSAPPRCLSSATRPASRTGPTTLWISRAPLSPMS